MLILASASPRRRELLERVGVTFATHPTDVDESVAPGESPLTYVRRVAAAKAAAVASDDDWILAADTTVARAGTIYGKAADAAEATAMLTALAGHTHQVTTAVVLRRGAEVHALEVSTEVDLGPLEPEVLADYVASQEWQGKAGAYAVQGIGAALVHAVRGSITNVIGLPLAEVVALLRATGAAPIHLARGRAA
ncbi:MAG: septum formation protein Maf [Kofleriaceae bacterium]|jgi:septum formation protein|nr:septum formation protein Maf [Kofleriaceae bacterium]MBP9172413.1 septum formation protein Maf [Kofleriaceae bacterium]MBP9863468.1 septum formation protein Maf [Kofleriaceae bacterium]